MKKNDRFELTIEDMGVHGEGIGHDEGMTFFVNGAVVGDRIQARAMKLKKHYGYARLEKIIEPSADRVQPPCPVANICGGCQLQALSYPKQLELKADRVRDALIRLGGFEASYIDSVSEPIIGMEEPFRYRNKAQYPIGCDRDGKVISGFYAAHSHRIVPVEDCLLGAEVNQQVLGIIKSYMASHNVEAYDEETGKGLLRHVLIRVGFHTGQIMVCLIVNGTFLPDVSDLTDALQTIEGMTSIVLNVNMKRTNVIMGDVTKVLWGQPAIRDTIGGVSFEISARSFYQVNPYQTEKLYGKALEYADLHGTETVWDLYCGIGTISLFLAQKAGEVYGVEIVPEAVEDAKRNADLNGIRNAHFYCGKAEEVLPTFYGNGSVVSEQHLDAEARNHALHPDVIVVDPPRKGCDEKCLTTMTQMAPERIVYVSCNPATLARDLKYLCANGYRLQKVCPVDQFPQGMHVETVVLLSQQKPDDTIEIDLDLDELDATSAELKATYQEIKDYVLKEFGLKVSSLYISQIKRKCGIEVGENYNLPKSENARVPQCPKEKEDAIKAALKYYAMI